MFFSGCCVFPSAPWDWSPALRINAIRFLHYPPKEMDAVALALVIKPSPAAMPLSFGGDNASSCTERSSDYVSFDVPLTETAILAYCVSSSNNSFFSSDARQHGAAPLPSAMATAAMMTAMMTAAAAAAAAGSDSDCCCCWWFRLLVVQMLLPQS